MRANLQRIGCNADALCVDIPANIEPMARYVVHWIFEERFGLNLAVRLCDQGHFSIRTAGSGRAIRVACVPEAWVAGSRPSAPRWCNDDPTDPDPTPDGLPVLFGRPEAVHQGGDWIVPFDLFGTVFWFLSRSEEIAPVTLDKHGRFRASNGWLARWRLLDRPVVDETVSWLKSRMLECWPGMELRTPEFEVRPTCDVDFPYDPGLRRPWLLLRAIAADIRSRSVMVAVQRLRNWVRSRKGDFSLDPNNRFEWMMKVCEARGRTLRFYFMNGPMTHPLDGVYTLKEPLPSSILRDSIRRGHEVGIHPSYRASVDAEIARIEVERFRATCRAARVTPVRWHSRQHFLRWNWRVTPRILSDLELDTDSTLGFCDAAGFRCGTSHSFPLWDWNSNSVLPVREEPLIAMERAVIARENMGLGRGEQTLEYLRRLRDRCARHGGRFLFLWHNSHLCDARDRTCFETLLT